MKLFNILTNLIIFVTDCDKTLVHYEKYEEDDSKLIPMPASSGSNQVGYVSLSTVDILGKIADLTEIICVSGMRYPTMLQRKSYFKDYIKYWICENGGKIFESVDGDRLEEIGDWKAHIKTIDGERKLLELHNFANTLLSEGWYVDQKGYETMFRVRVPTTMSMNELSEKILQRIPTAYLKYTFNLKYLDIYINGSGKYAAVKWLLSWIKNKKKKSHITSNSINIQDKQESSCEAVSTTSSITHNDIHVHVHTDKQYHKTNKDDEDIQYYFLGDDTNDIEIASYAQVACIVSPSSTEMKEFMQSEDSNPMKRVMYLDDNIHQSTDLSTSVTDIASTSTSTTTTTTTTTSSSSSTIKRRDLVTTKTLQGYKSTETLLEYILQLYNRN